MIGIDMVDIYVGPEKEHFHVHRVAVCSKIPYFEKIFKDGGFAESYTISATFPEDDPGSFDLLLGWVYHGSIKVPAARTDDIGDLRLSWLPDSLYKLTEKICLPQLQDQVIDMFIGFSRQTDSMPSTSTIMAAYSESRKNSGLRRYYAQSLAFILVQGDKCSAWTVDELTDTMSKEVELTRDVFTVLIDSKGNVKDPVKEPDCKYHCHADNEPCYKDINKNNYDGN
jgi:hypothetical protein